ncbi:uncharacterized protein MELLADRAFT_71475 [Melampsora larici-populina 98AG31]|uniref:Uncharacterized protein n=1 Tax=Melampsora larici-populina (strain 98AG31 / pathotype 3-4-7) TaxID=747676 RepID=F4RH53_MELLP|nr:uncharacterized protein MELLADRAFT_71475 [Melampsora larici-populina 98AG31]EGG08392.1 hypothetical protein MELLADRAFT_71475 [Melampsora larici-populina 98AG31]
MYDESPDESKPNSQFDLPALKRLYLISDIPLPNFKDCKNLQFVKCDSEIKEDQWHSIKDLLYSDTWPKLSVLDLRRSWFLAGSPGQAQKEVDEIGNFNVKLMLSGGYSSKAPWD